MYRLSPLRERIKIQFLHIISAHFVVVVVVVPHPISHKIWPTTARRPIKFHIKIGLSFRRSHFLRHQKRWLITLLPANFKQRAKTTRGNWRNKSTNISHASATICLDDLSLISLIWCPNINKLVTDGCAHCVSLISWKQFYRFVDPRVWFSTVFFANLIRKWNVLGWACARHCCFSAAISLTFGQYLLERGLGAFVIAEWLWNFFLGLCRTLKIGEWGVKRLQHLLSIRKKSSSLPKPF